MTPLDDDVEVEDYALNTGPLVTSFKNTMPQGRLHGALSSMSEAVLQYKNLGPARDRLLAWLALRGA